MTLPLRSGEAGVAADTLDELEASRANRPRLRGWLHLVGTGVMVLAGPFLVASATTATRRWGVTAFVLGVVAMLATSGAYHVLRWRQPWLGRMRRADHSAIFLAIAGTYTPFVLEAMTGSVRTWLLVAVWIGASIGITVNQVAHHAPAWVRTIPALALGWAAVVLIPALWALSPAITWLVAAGGVAYTLGAIAYATRWPRGWPRWFGHHELFHALTLAAILLHAWGVALATTGPT